MISMKQTAMAAENREPDIRTKRIRLVGDSPLVMHRFYYRDKDCLTPYGILKEMCPVEHLARSIYWLADDTEYPGSMQAAADIARAKTMDEFRAGCGNGAVFGYPADRIKDAVVKTVRKMGWVPDSISARTMFFIEGKRGPEGLLRIIADPPSIRKICVYTRAYYCGTEYIAQFESWTCEFEISYNANGKYTLDEIVNMFNCTGYTCGIGDWRVKDGESYGNFHVEA